MEVLLEIIGTIIVDVMIADNQEARIVFSLCFSIVAKCGFGHSEACLTALVDHVAGMNGKNGFRIIALGSDVLVETVVLALRHDAVAF